MSMGALNQVGSVLSDNGFPTAVTVLQSDSQESSSINTAVAKVAAQLHQSPSVSVLQSPNKSPIPNKSPTSRLMINALPSQQALSTNAAINSTSNPTGIIGLGKKIAALFSCCLPLQPVADPVQEIEEKIKVTQDKFMLDSLWIALSPLKMQKFVAVAEDLSGELVNLLGQVKRERSKLASAVEGIFRESAVESEVQGELKSRILGTKKVTRTWKVQQEELVLLAALVKRVCGYLPTSFDGATTHQSTLVFQLRTIFKLVDEMSQWEELKGKCVDKAGFARAAPSIYIFLPQEHRKSRRLSATPITVQTSAHEAHVTEEKMDHLSDLFSLKLHVNTPVTQAIATIRQMEISGIEKVLPLTSGELELEACYKEIGVRAPEKLNQAAESLADEIIDVLQVIQAKPVILPKQLFTYKERVVQDQLLKRVLGKPVQHFSDQKAYISERGKDLSRGEECQLMMTLFCRLCNFISEDKVSEALLQKAYTLFHTLFQINSSMIVDDEARSTVALAAGKGYSFYTHYLQHIKPQETKSLIA